MENRVKKVMSSIFGIEESIINTETTFNNVETWDSLNHIKLILSLEEEFSIKFDDEDIIEMLSYNNICKKIMEKL